MFRIASTAFTGDFHEAKRHQFADGGIALDPIVDEVVVCAQQESVRLRVALIALELDFQPIHDPTG
jgi:hypothetical protein